MTRREKLLEKMRNSPKNIPFAEVDALLRAEGFLLFSQQVATEPIIAQMARYSLLYVQMVDARPAIR